MDAMANAIGSARAEGVEPSPLTLDLLRQMSNGEITDDEAVHILLDSLGNQE